MIQNFELNIYQVLRLVTRKLVDNLLSNHELLVSSFVLSFYFFPLSESGKFGVINALCKQKRLMKQYLSIISA